MILQIAVVRIVTPCSIVGGYRRCGGTCYASIFIRRNMLSQSSGLEMGAVRFSETSVSSYKITGCYNPADHNLKIKVLTGLPKYFNCRYMSVTLRFLCIVFLSYSWLLYYGIGRHVIW
jgi:hypothetical protein